MCVAGEVDFVRRVAVNQLTNTSYNGFGLFGAQAAVNEVVLHIYDKK